MVGPIERFMAADHARLDALFAQAVRADATVDPAPFELFRREMLRHIAMESNVLLPFARQRRGGVPLPHAAALRLYHGLVATLLTPPPSVTGCRRLRTVLGGHVSLEAGEQGLYAACDALAEPHGQLVVARLRAQPRVRIGWPQQGEETPPRPR